MLNIWKQASRAVQATDGQDLPKLSEKRAREIQGEVASQDTRSPKRVRVERVKNTNHFQDFLNELEHSNVILQVEDTTTRVAISVRVLNASVVLEKRRVSANYRTSLIVVEDDISALTYASSLRNLSPNHLEVAIYDPSDSPDQWEHLACRDVTVLRFHAFLSALVEGRLSVSQIHTLIINDLDSIQNLKSDPVVRIMDLCRLVDLKSRPRVFAMVAPLNVDVGPQLADFETTFDAHVFPVEHSQWPDFDVPKGLIEFVVRFDHDSTPNHPYHSLEKFLPADVVATELFQSYLRDSARILRGLGPAAYYIYWQQLAKDMEASLRSCEANSLQQFDPTLKLNPTKRLILGAIKSSMPTVSSPDLTSQEHNVTQKFVKLVQILRSCGSCATAFRVIVFVSDHNVALILADMLGKVHDLKFVRSHAICAQNRPANGKHADEILEQFTLGTLNLLVATESTEDFDFPETSTVICFDPTERHLSYACRRALATNQLVHMAERGNVTEYGNLKRVMLMPRALEGWVCRASEPAGAILPAPISETNQSFDSNDDSPEDDFILDPTTTRRLYPRHSLSVVYLLAAKLADSNRPLFEYTQCSHESQICTVILSSGSLFSRISGSAHPLRADARRSACYQVCRKMFDEGLLDYRYFPGRNACLTPTSNEEKTHEVECFSHNLSDEPKANGVRSHPRRAPDFWINSSLVPFTRLFPTVIFSKQGGEHLSPLVLLTRLPLPDLPSFDIFFSGVASNICLQKGLPFPVEIRQISELRRFTLRLHRMIGNKPFVCDQQGMLYLFAPLTASWNNNRTAHYYDLPDVASHIAWDAVTLAASKAFVHMNTDTPKTIGEELHDAVIQDRWVEYTRRYFVVKLRHDMSPSSKPGEGEREAEYNTYLEYCNARVSAIEGLKYPETPLIQVEVVPGILNRLDPTLRPQLLFKGAAKYLIPELCGKCTIPASILKTALAFPSILTRVNEFLLTKELNAKLFSNTVSDELLRTALTPPSAGTDVNYERLEILGDAVLKYTASAYAFIVHPSNTEGSLHRHRREIIANRTLSRSATDIGIPQFILSKDFSAKRWYPAGFTVRDSFNYIEDDNMEPKDPLSPGFKRHTEQRAHKLGDKTLADVVEAIVAAAYLSGGNEATVTVMKSLTIPVLEYDRTSEMGRNALPLPPLLTASLVPPAVMKRVEDIIGHNFVYPYYLVQVLNKACLQGFESTSVERLKFLGNGILDFLTMKYIYDREPDLPPGALTLLKCAMVSNSTLATLCVRSGIYEFVDSGAYRLGNTLQRYATAVVAAHRQEHELAKKERRSPGQYWRDIECPKIVPDIMEAILGALYVSDNCCLLGAERFFNNIFKPFYDTHITLQSLSRHATSTILELFQKRRCDQYSLLKESRNGRTRCKVMLHGFLLGEATDSMASNAMRKACESSLQALVKDPRTCNCDVPKMQVEKAARNAADALKSTNKQTL